MNEVKWKMKHPSDLSGGGGSSSSSSCSSSSSKSSVAVKY